jgi:hypothetical protein
VEGRVRILTPHNTDLHPTISKDLPERLPMRHYIMGLKPKQDAYINVSQEKQAMNVHRGNCRVVRLMGVK